jgi:hypothetical protein
MENKGLLMHKPSSWGLEISLGDNFLYVKEINNAEDGFRTGTVQRTVSVVKSVLKYNVYTLCH